MSRVLKALIADDGGQDLAEYGIALGIIGLVAGAVAVVVAQNVGSLWSRAQSVVAQVVTTA